MTFKQCTSRMAALRRRGAFDNHFRTFWPNQLDALRPLVLYFCDIFSLASRWCSRAICADRQAVKK